MRLNTNKMENNIELIEGKLVVTYRNDNKELKTYVVTGKDLIDLLNLIKESKKTPKLL